MKQRSNEYWEARAIAQSSSYELAAIATDSHLNRAYNRAAEAVDSSVQRIFGTFMRNGGLTEDEARQLLNGKISTKAWNEIKAQLPSVTDDKLRRRMLAMLNAPAYAARISREEALKADINIKMAALASKETIITAESYVMGIRAAYYRNMYEIQKGLGLGFSFDAIPQSTIDQIVANPWSGEHFSSRIWGNTSLLAQQLQSVITGGLVAGLGAREMTKDIQRRFDTGKFAASRLVRTEYTYMTNAAEIESYKAAEINQYQFIATLDKKTSRQCQRLDLQIFPTSAAAAGINLPPMHPFCRSTTRAWFDILATNAIERRARDSAGKPITVPANMKYSDWIVVYGKE